MNTRLAEFAGFETKVDITDKVLNLLQNLTDKGCMGELACLPALFRVSESRNAA